jgi:Na+/melibiose symporter-like transporter
LEKRTVLAATLGLGPIGRIAKWWLVTPEAPNWQTRLAMILVPGTSGYRLITNSLKADTVDHDELHGGYRREGLGGLVSSCGDKHSPPT